MRQINFRQFATAVFTCG